MIGAGVSAPRHGRLDPARDIGRRVGARGLRRIDDGHVAVGRRRIVDALSPGSGGHKQRNGDQNWSFHTISPEHERQGGDHGSFTLRWVAASAGNGNQLAIAPDALSRLSSRQPTREVPNCGRPRGRLIGLRLLRRRRDDAGAGGVGLVLDSLCRRRLNQEGQECDCCQNAAHGQTPE